MMNPDGGRRRSRRRQARSFGFSENVKAKNAPETLPDRAFDNVARARQVQEDRGVSRVIVVHGDPISEIT
jgi:hypothetical protein